MRRHLYAVLLLPLLLACGGASGGDEGQSRASTPASTPATTSASSGSAPSAPTSPSGATSSPATGSRAIPQSVLGTVSVKQGDCLLFTPGDRAESWVLTGAVGDLKPGQGYTLEGVMDDTSNPACTQGPTFIVTTATPAG